jgi:amino acid transporter
VAFGDFAGFEIGWMQWFSRATSQASIMTATTLALGYYWPALTTGWPRAIVLLLLTLVFAAINVRGVRQSSWTVNVLTIGKLVPLAVFITIGLLFIQPSRLTTLPPISIQQAGAAALLLIFIYGGYEVVPVPAGEALNPKRDVPFAIVATVFGAMIIMTLAQVVAQGVLVDVAAHTTPLADAAAVWLTYVSHWPADYITGLKPTWPGGPTVGLYLYARPIPEFFVEAVVKVYQHYNQRKIFHQVVKPYRQ